MEIIGGCLVGVIQLMAAVWASPKESVGAPDQLTVSQHSKSESEGWYPLTCFWLTVSWSGASTDSLKEAHSLFSP